MPECIQRLHLQKSLVDGYRDGGAVWLARMCNGPVLLRNLVNTARNIVLRDVRSNCTACAPDSRLGCLVHSLEQAGRVRDVYDQ